MSVLALETVWKYYGDFPALCDVSFDLGGGVCLALLGRNGAGKTTLLRILAGLARAERGKVMVLGGDPRRAETRARIGVLGHGLALYEELSALENLALYARLYQLDHPRREAEAWLERVGLLALRDSLVREFSRGMRQRLAIARALLHDPEVLLLDEPFSALDDQAVGILSGLLVEAQRRGRTVVVSTHQWREVLELASHVAVLARGRLAYFGARRAEMLEDAGWLSRQYGKW